MTPDRSKLTWSKGSKKGTVQAWSGQLHVGFVLQRTDGTFAWQIDAVFTRHICKGHGDCPSIAAGRRSLQHAWRRWVDHAGLG